jgi:hypothetical protein
VDPIRNQTRKNQFSIFTKIQSSSQNQLITRNIGVLNGFQLRGASRWKESMQVIGKEPMFWPTGESEQEKEYKENVKSRVRLKKSVFNIILYILI